MSDRAAKRLKLSHSFNGHSPGDVRSSNGPPLSLPPRLVPGPEREALPLAKRALGDLNSLLEFMTMHVPELCKSSQLETAQNIVAGLVMQLQQITASQQQQLSPRERAAPSPRPARPPGALAAGSARPSPVPPAPGRMASGMAPLPEAPGPQQLFPPPPQPALPQLRLPGMGPMGYPPLGMFVPFEANVRPKPPADLPPDCTMDHFQLLEILGTGTFAKVRLVRHKISRRFFCMKIMNKSKIIRMKQADHISNERNVLSTVAHPFIVKLYRTFKDERNVYLLLEFVPGGELFNYLRKAQRLPDAVARIYAAEIILALEELHKNNVLYRDLKPENLLIDDYGHIKLTDFGFAKPVRDRTFSMCGTPEYIAPEIVMNKGHDAAVDWWSLGVLIYEMLSGYPPFTEDPDERTGATRTVFEKILGEEPDIPDWVEPLPRDLILQLLQKTKELRLGCRRGDQGAAAIKRHPWFKGLDWQALTEKRSPGPLNPNLTTDGDIHNFYKFSEDFDPSSSDPPLTPDQDELFKDF